MCESSIRSRPSVTTIAKVRENRSDSDTTPVDVRILGDRPALITGLTVTVLYTALSLFCWNNLLAAGVTTHMYRLNLGDAGQRIWFIAWLPFAITHHTNPFVSNFMFAPRGINVLANASVVFEAFLLAPITELSSPLTAFNIACIAAPVISALSLYYVLRRYEIRRLVAFVGGLAYGFAPALLRADRIGDLNLTWMFFPPLAAYLIDRIFFRQTGRPVRLGLILGLLVVIQFFSSLEILLVCVVVSIPVLTLAIVANPRELSSHVGFTLKAMGTALVTAGTLLAYPMAIYLTGPEHISSVNRTVAPGAALSSPVWPSTATGTGFLEAAPRTPLLHLFDSAFIGPVVLLLALAALAFSRRHRVVLLLWAAALWCVVLSWGGATRLSGSSRAFSWHAPAWYLAKAVPILRNVDWIRISIITDLFLVMLAAVTLQEVASAIQARDGRWRRPLIDAMTVGTGVLMAIPLFIASYVPFAAFQTVAVPEVLRHVPNRTNGSPSTALIFPASTPFSGTPLVWQAIAGFPYRDYEGYAWHSEPGQKTAVAGPLPGLLPYITANAPDSSPSIVLTDEQERDIKLAFVHNHVTEAVIIGGYPGSRQLTRAYDQIFGAGQQFGNGEIWNTTKTSSALFTTSAIVPLGQVSRQLSSR
jgi:hypothetical protein